VPTQKQQREAARRRLERQLKARQVREARRKKMTLIISIVGTLALIGAVIGIIVATTGSSGKKHPKAESSASVSPSGSSSPAVPRCGSATPTSFTAKPAKGAAVTFMGVTVKGAADLTGQPQVSSHSAKPAPKLEVKDLVVGKGKVATPTSCVTVQYDGVLYSDGKEFDSSWKRGQTAEFSLAGVVQGFTQGIGGTTGVPPMKVGGRRLMILPAALGYGAQPPAGSGIPPNASLVFVVDLKSIRTAS
jgi:peptidylprolyl isomerase